MPDPEFALDRVGFIPLHDMGFASIALSSSGAVLEIERVDALLESREVPGLSDVWACRGTLKLQHLASLALDGGWPKRKLCVSAGDLYAEGKKLGGEERVALFEGLSNVMLFLTLDHGGELVIKAGWAQLELVPLRFVRTLRNHYRRGAASGS